jgi:hypothetical protein
MYIAYACFLLHKCVNISFTMSDEILLTDIEYARIRCESKAALYRYGIRNNVDPSNRTIVKILSLALEKPPIDTQDTATPETVALDVPEKATDYSPEQLRDYLGALMDLKPPILTKEVELNLRSLP